MALHTASVFFALFAYFIAATFVPTCALAATFHDVLEHTDRGLKYNLVLLNDPGKQDWKSRLPLMGDR